jgi:hypothetical protein
VLNVIGDVYLVLMDTDIVTHVPKTELKLQLVFVQLKLMKSSDKLFAHLVKSNVNLVSILPITV